jgi:uncharacterized protein (DUF305 family)
MNKESIIYAVTGLLLGIVLMGFTAAFAVNNEHEGMMDMMGMRTNSARQITADHESTSMANMSAQLRNKSGDEFDKAFIEMMIVHHQGAIDMAELIPARAKHDEIKQLGEAIISAQTKEIQDMQQWQKDWGYSNDETMRMMH